MVAVWADLAPAFAFSLTDLNSEFKGFQPPTPPIPPDTQPKQDPQITLIQQALVNLYNGSATARALIDQGFTKKITIYFCPDANNSFAFPGANIISINPAIVNNLVWMGVDGTLHKEILEDTVIHELVHAITGRDDYTDSAFGKTAYNAANYNFPGPTQYVANQVMLELGRGPGFRQAGYLATVDPGSLYPFRFDLSYTEGNLVSGAVMLNGSPNGDVSQNTFSYLGDTLYGTALNSDLARNKNLLVIGDSRNNQIKGNVGNDSDWGGYQTARPVGLSSGRP
jgi:hypothetical protein